MWYTCGGRGGAAVSVLWALGRCRQEAETPSESQVRPPQPERSMRASGPRLLKCQLDKSVFTLSCFTSHQKSEFPTNQIRFLIIRRVLSRRLGPYVGWGDKDLSLRDLSSSSRSRSEPEAGRGRRHNSPSHSKKWSREPLFLESRGHALHISSALGEPVSGSVPQHQNQAHLAPRLRRTATNP